MVRPDPWSSTVRADSDLRDYRRRTPAATASTHGHGDAAVRAGCAAALEAEPAEALAWHRRGHRSPAQRWRGLGNKRAAGKPVARSRRNIARDVLSSSRHAPAPAPTA